MQKDKPITPDMPFSFRDTQNRRRVWLLALLAAAFLAIFWSQVLSVPYWQDDYYYLLDAKKAHLENRPWYEPFLPKTNVSFWRPLGMETYWRFLETFLHGNVKAAHVANILMLLASAAAVGWFVATLLRRLAPERAPLLAGLSAAFLYCLHASHFLPVAWVAAANDSICVFFSALTLRFWLVVSTAKDEKKTFATLMLVLCLAAALLSRDIAFVLPALGLLLTVWLWPYHKPSVIAWAAGSLCVGIALIWLIARQYFTLPPDPAYAFRFSRNVIRNAACLIAFFFNTPFEALRYFFFVKASPSFVLWGLACFLLQLTASWLLLRGARDRLDRRGLSLLIAFFAVGCAPYFFLSRNCYPYYISLGLFAYAVVAGLSTLRPRVLTIVILLTVLSSSVSTLGNYLLDSPSHIGRARWAERQLRRLTELRSTQPQLFTGTFPIVVYNTHKFLGFGVDGLVYRLGIERKKIVVIEPGDLQSFRQTVLVVPDEGDVYFTPERAREH